MGKTKSKLSRYLYPSGVTGKTEINQDKVEFALTIGELPIGTLKLEKGIWVFNYSNEFKNQFIYKPLTEFPDIDKEYKSRDLWPFFLSRIPAANNINIVNRGYQEVDLVGLLKNFGSKTTTNPYTLQMGQ